MKNKQYKLLQKYPSLPGDWEVGMVVALVDSVVKYSPIVSKYCNYKISKREVENFPYFWEEIDKKIPEFITRDGVTIYEDDMYYFVAKDWSYGSMYALHGIVPNITFSTFELAQKYVKENKPKFSEKQINDAIETNFQFTHHLIDVESFKETLKIK